MVSAAEEYIIVVCFTLLTIGYIYLLFSVIIGIRPKTESLNSADQSQTGASLPSAQGKGAARKKVSAFADVMPIFKITLFGTILGFASSSTMYLIDIILKINSVQHPVLEPVATIGGLFMFIGRGCMVISFIARLYYVFLSTAFALPNHIFRFMLATYTIFIGLEFVVLGHRVYIGITDKHTYQTVQYTWHIVVTFVYFIVDLAINITVVIIFFRKLTRLFFLLDDDNHDKANDDKNQVIVDVGTKSVFLVVMASISTILGVIFSLIISTQVVSTLEIIPLQIDSYFNCLVVYWLFSLGNDGYVKYCGACQKRFGDTCLRKHKMAIEQQVKRDLEE